MGSFALFLTIHILAGTVCLFTGIIAATAKKRAGRHTFFGDIYHYAYVAVFITSIVMAIWQWGENAHLFYIALFSYGLALFGYLARKRKWKDWLVSHIVGMVGSYIGIITAVLITNQSYLPFIKEWPSLLLWFLPTIIGTPLIFYLTSKHVSEKSESF